MRTFTGKVWYGPRDKKPVVSSEFSTPELVRQWIFQQPAKKGRARRRSTVLQFKLLYQIIE